ncbi:hypothetical protein ACFQZ4_35430 [Catellatospora coxensis]
MTALPDREAVGTLLRHVLELLDGDVAKVYAERDLADYRPRYSPWSARCWRRARCRSATSPGPSASPTPRPARPWPR